MNPIDEALAAKASMTKEASGGLRGLIGDAGKAVMKDARRGAVEGAAGALAGAAALALVPAAKKVFDGIQSRRDFKQMVQMYPGLADVHRGSPEMFNAAYNSLRRVNPTFGQDPLIAGSYMSAFFSGQHEPHELGKLISGTVKQPNPGPRPTNVTLGAQVGPFNIQHPI